MNPWKIAHELTEEGTPFVVVTLVNIRGSAPQDAGAKIIVTRDGLYAGTVGGGKVENACIKKAQEILESHQQNEPFLVTWNLQKDIGMSCGGETSFFFEQFHQNQWPVVIFGAGHVGQSLSRVLSKLKCHVTVIDPRQEWIEKLKDVKGIVHPNPPELIATLNPNSFFLSVTMGHVHDYAVLLALSQHAPNAPYIGSIGSEVKAIKLKKDLKEAGASDEFIKNIHIPMGLKFGSNDPEEIAISIAAELLQVRDQFYKVNL